MMNRLPVSIFLILHVFSILVFPKNQVSYLNTDSLNNYIEEKVIDWKIPGLAIAIVRNNKTVFVNGYGLREAGKNKKIDGNTVFAIASITKTFTSAAYSTLVDQKKVYWEQRVIEFLPDFKMYNRQLTKNISVRDILSHGTRLKTFSGDLIWYGSSYTSKEIIERIKFLEPEYDFRSGYGYSNILYMVAGEIIYSITGEPWEGYINDIFIKPLNLNNTYTLISDLMTVKNVAQPHVEYKNEIIPIEYMDWHNIGAAGSMYSSANDLSEWIKFLLNNKPGLLPQVLKDEMWKIQTPVKINLLEQNIWPKLSQKGYGLGWQVSYYNDIKIVSHSGGYEGMVSQICLIPGENFGFVILCNINKNLPYPLMYHIIDEYFGFDHIDYATYIKNYNDSIKKEQEIFYTNLEKQRDTAIKPSISINDIIGKYSSSLYNFARIYYKDNQIFIEFTQSPLFTGKLDHYKGNKFYIEFTGIKSLPKGIADFVVEDGMINLRINIPNPDFDFSELKFKKQINQ